MTTPPPLPYDYPDTPEKAVALILKGFQHEMEAILQSNNDYKTKKRDLKKLCDTLKKGINKAEDAKFDKGTPLECAQRYSVCSGKPQPQSPTCDVGYFNCMCS